ncbi:F-box/LRR-repeat protein At5g02910-like isoform X3 [Euphorbia lathyris]|uniref:F-box/LRR-repeat protein At5g02910-like isoform X3 n=1 Tax=Euphorbia lathyris TaxID=212925 RepID=UPI003313D3E3
MAGSGGASIVESEGSGVGSCDSENGNKRIKSGEEEEEDRLSALPDFLIHRILSFLPATDLVKTLALSKWWKYQWTHVPVLKFFPNDDEMSHNDCINLLQTIAQIEHVEKLEIGRWLIQILSTLEHDDCIDDCVDYLPDSDIHRIVSFLPLTKDAFERDLYKMCPFKWTDDPILNFVSNEKFFIDSKNIPLMYLDPRLSLWIRFAAIKTVKELILDCDSTNLQFRREYVLPEFVFNNSSLVKMKLCACYFMPEGKVNWESLKSLQLDHSELGNQALEHVLSGSPLLECLELRCCSFEGAVVVASEHLKTFILEEFGKDCPALEISCPNLESLKIWGQVGSTFLKLTDLPSSLHATLDLYILESDDISRDDCMNLVEETMKQILHVKEVEIALTRRGAINSELVLKDIRVRKDGFT